MIKLSRNGVSTRHLSLLFSSSRVKVKRRGDFLHTKEIKNSKITFKIAPENALVYLCNRDAIMQ